MDADLFARLQSEIDRVEPQAGLDPAALLELPDEVRRLVQAIAREAELTLSELAAATGRAEADLPALLAVLEAKGLVEVVGGAGGGAGGVDLDPAAPAGERGGPRYRVAFGRRRTRELPVDLWALLDDRTRG